MRQYELVCLGVHSPSRFIRSVTWWHVRAVPQQVSGGILQGVAPMSVVNLFSQLDEF